VKASGDAESNMSIFLSPSPPLNYEMRILALNSFDMFLRAVAPNGYNWVTNFTEVPGLLS
jgi:hypothetical protein